MKWVRFYFKEIVDRIGRWIAGVNLSWENIWTEPLSLSSKSDFFFQ